LAQHKWKKGDSFSALAAANGLATWQEIWNDPANQTLQTKRVTPDKVLAGDLVEIPAKQLGEFSRPTDARHQLCGLACRPLRLNLSEEWATRSENQHRR
jgi:hypothetical protein